NRLTLQHHHPTNHRLDAGKGDLNGVRAGRQLSELVVAILVGHLTLRTADERSPAHGDGGARDGRAGLRFSDASCQPSVLLTHRMSAAAYSRSEQQDHDEGKALMSRTHGTSLADRLRPVEWEAKAHREPVPNMAPTYKRRSFAPDSSGDRN